MFFRVFLPKHGLFFLLIHLYTIPNCTKTVWWFGTFFIFHNIWNKFSHWLIFFRGVGIPPTRKHLLTTSYHMGMDQYLLNPINTIFSGMNIHKSQLFWCELQGYKVLTHPHMNGYSMVIYHITTVIYYINTISYPCFSWKKTHHVLRPRLVQAESRGARLRRLRARAPAAQVHPGVAPGPATDTWVSWMAYKQLIMNN